MSFKEYLKHSLEEQLKECPGDNPMNIACINLAYDNSEIIKLLTKRGKLLVAGKYD